MSGPVMKAMVKKKLFGKKKEEEKDLKDKQIVVEGQEEEVQESMAVLAEDKSSVDEVVTEVESAVRQASRDSLKGLKLLEEGRCPECSRKAQQFLFTSVCPQCGWSSFISPKDGEVIVHLKDGSMVSCKGTFDTQHEDILCIADDVVRARIGRDNINYIEYSWTNEEIQERRNQREQEVTGVCHWCGKKIDPEEDERIVVYAALGRTQERYLFCSNKCKGAFEKQYPARVHRNCYERSCLDCEECIKRYDGSDETILQSDLYVR